MECLSPPLVRKLSGLGCPPLQAVNAFLILKAWQDLLHRHSRLVTIPFLSYKLDIGSYLSIGRHSLYAHDSGWAYLPHSLGEAGSPEAELFCISGYDLWWVINCVLSEIIIWEH